MIKEYLEKTIEQKRSQIEKLEAALVECETKEERSELAETLKNVRSELDEAEKALVEAEAEEEKEEKEDEVETKEGEESRNKRLEVLGTYTQRGLTPEMQNREAEYQKVMEERGKALKEKRSITVSTGKGLLPQHSGTQLNDTFRPVSTLVDLANSENIPGGESYKEAFVVSYGTGGITGEGEEYTEAEPNFNYASMNKVKITAYAELSEEMKKLPNVDYAGKVEAACIIALKKKLSEQMLNGTGTEQIVGLFKGTPVAIDASKDIELTAIDNNTLNEVIFNYGGDEEVETEAAIILNKKTLKALAEVRNTDGTPAYDIDVKNKTIDTIPYIINSNTKDFTSASTGDYVMAYGDPRSYKVVTFSDVEIVESTDYKFREGFISFKASAFVGGNVIKQDGLLRVKKK